MALQTVTRTGTLSSPYTNHTYHLYLVCTENSTNISTNKSNITLRQYAYSTSTVYQAYSGSTTGNSYWIKVDGSNVVYGTKSMDFRNKATVELGSWTGDVAHNADGTLSITVSSGFDINGPSSLYDGAVPNYSWSLTTIPRASDISSFPNFTIGSGVTVSAPRNSTGFTNEFKIYIGASLIHNTGKLSQDSYTFTAAQLDGIYAKIPTSTSATATLYVNSYNGTTLLGQASKTATATVGSNIIPTLSSVSAAETYSPVSALSLGTNNFVQNLSRIKFTINGASGTKSSTISSYKITFNGVNYGQNGVTGAVNKTGSVTATATVTDSRGRVSSAKTVVVTMLAYNAPSISSFSAGRNSTTQTQIDVSAAASISALNNKNTLSYKISIKEKSASAWPSALTTISLTAGTNTMSTSRQYSTYAGTSSFDVRLEVTDKFNTSTSILSVATESVPISISKTGVGAGKIWEQGALDVGGTSFFNGEIDHSGGGFSSESIYRKGKGYVGATWSDNGGTALTVDGKDMNNITDSGTYRGYNMTNSAVAVISTFIVIKYSGDWITQIQYTIEASPRTFMRSRHSGTTWSSWERINNYEAGSNANGHYLKMYGGLMISWGTIDQWVAITTTWGGLQISAQFAATFPVVFSYRPAFTVSWDNGGDSNFAMIDTIYSTSARFRFARGVSLASSSGTIRWMAIGRWY